MKTRIDKVYEKLTAARRKTRELTKIVKNLTYMNERAEKKFQDFLQLADRNRQDSELRLSEARRRTIPCDPALGSGSEINFLPIAITRVEIKHNLKEMHSIQGTSVMIPGRCSATIECEGDLYHITNGKAQA